MIPQTILSRYIAVGTGVAQLLALQFLWIAGVLRGVIVTGFGPASRAIFMMLPQIFTAQPDETWRKFWQDYWRYFRQNRRHWSAVGVTHILHSALIISGMYVGVTHAILPRFLALAILLYLAINSTFLWYIAAMRTITWIQSLIVPFMWAVANPLVLLSTTVILGSFLFLLWIALPLALIIGISGSAAIVWRLSQGAKIPAS